MSTIVHATSSSDPTLVVFGRDGAGKPRASWFDAINADLADAERASVSVGLAELRPDDSVEALIARADDALYRKRGGTTPPEV